MTDARAGFVCLLRARPGPRTAIDPHWEAQRHENEVRYWAAHLDELASFLPGIRRRRGDARGARLVRDVIAEIKTTKGEDAGVIARDLLGDVWRRGRRRP